MARSSFAAETGLSRTVITVLHRSVMVWGSFPFACDQLQFLHLSQDSAVMSFFLAEWAFIGASDGLPLIRIAPSVMSSSNAKRIELFRGRCRYSPFQNHFP